MGRWLLLAAAAAVVAAVATVISVSAQPAPGDDWPAGYTAVRTHYVGSEYQPDCLVAFSAGGTDPNGNPVAKEQWCELLAEGGHQVVADSHACLSIPVIRDGRQVMNWAEFVDLDSDGVRDPGEPDADTPPIDYDSDNAYDSPGVPAIRNPAGECIPPVAVQRCAAAHTAAQGASGDAARLAAVEAVRRCLRGP